jgi:hypothetical protein
MLKNYRELAIWEKAYQLCLMVYRLTKRFSRTLEPLNPRTL